MRHFASAMRAASSSTDHPSGGIPLPAAHAAANAFSSRVAEAAAGDRSPPRKIL
jgi:hypothetical protein